MDRKSKALRASKCFAKAVQRAIWLAEERIYIPRGTRAEFVATRKRKYERLQRVARVALASLQRAGAKLPGEWLELKLSQPPFELHWTDSVCACDVVLNEEGERVVLQWDRMLRGLRLSEQKLLGHETGRSGKTLNEILGSPPTPLQSAIWQALDHRSLKKERLADSACGGDASRLYRPGGLKEMMDKGCVMNKRTLGYYRPDAPPG